MCRRFVIVYRACKANSNQHIQLPTCTPERSQVREYVNSEGWQFCKESREEKQCVNTIPLSHQCTFIESYCSDVCEAYYEGSAASGNMGAKDRLTYLDAPPHGHNLPLTANRGNLLVDFERVRLIYKALFNYIEELIEDTDNESEDNPIDTGFPISMSFPAMAAVLFFASPLSDLSEEILGGFPAMVLEDKVQILQRVMAAMSIINRNLRTLSAQEHIESRMNVNNNQSARWAAYKEDTGFGTLSLPAVREHLDPAYMVVIKFANRLGQKMPDPVPWNEEDLRNTIHCLVEDIHVFESREAEEGVDLDEIIVTHDVEETRIQKAIEEGTLAPVPLTAEQPRSTASGTAGSMPRIQQLKRGRNDSSEEPRSRSASPMTDPKGKAPAAKASTRKAGVVHPTAGNLAPVEESETPRRSARLMSGKVQAGNRGAGPRATTQTIVGEQELQLRPNSRMPQQTESGYSAPPKKKARTPTKKAKK